MGSDQWKLDAFAAQETVGDQLGEGHARHLCMPIAEQGET